MGTSVTDVDKRQLDELDIKIEEWVKQNQTASDVMGVLVKHLGEQAATYHIPPPVSYVYLSVMAFLQRDLCMRAVKNGDVTVEQVEALDAFAVRMTKDGMDWMRMMLDQIKASEEMTATPVAPVKAPLDKMYQ